MHIVIGCCVSLGFIWFLLRILVIDPVWTDVQKKEETKHDV